MTEIKKNNLQIYLKRTATASGRAHGAEWLREISLVASAASVSISSGFVYAHGFWYVM
jgi:hypothetical protein